MSLLNPGNRATAGWVIAALLLLIPVLPASELSDWEVDQPAAPSFEENSPGERLPWTVETGLTSRAIPTLPTPEMPYSLLPLKRLQFMHDIRLVQPRPVPDHPDPSSFRTVTVDVAPIGLHPRIFRKGLLEFYPWFGIAQSFESNVNLTSANPIADFYLTPRAGMEFQLGTPDSVYNEFYDTILALHGRYEGWADLFYGNPKLSAFNQEMQFAGRIGRMGAIWRPSFGYSDITGSNLLLSELINRTRRLRTTADLVGQYQFTSMFGANQTFSFYQLQHPDPGYINYAVMKTRQELTWKAHDQTRITTWGEYRFTNPDQGFRGSEMIFGLGWYGKPDSRITTDMRIGWDTMQMEGNVPGRQNMSGLRFNGRTTFDWSTRLRLALIYDREYAFNEQTVNDNYVSTLLQLKAEVYLGGSWYLVPYLGGSLQEFEIANALAIQLRPELEIAYALPNYYYPMDSKIFMKIGYMSSSYLRGTGDPVEDWRLSMGFNCKF